MNFYVDDVVLLPPSEPAVVGKGAVRIYWSKAMKQVTTLEGASLFDEIIVFGDWAYARGKYEGRSRLTSDGREFEDRLNFSGLWRRDSDGSWRIARDMWNSGDDSE
jgi:ketosteroid isomerase-like protein